jgi:hypothetical protein
MQLGWLYFWVCEATYTEVLAEGAVDGDVLLGSEISKRLVRVVTGEGAVRAGCVAVLAIVRTTLSQGYLTGHTQRLIKTSSIGSQVLTSITPISSSSGMPTCVVLA